MFSEANNDEIACMLKANPEFETIISTIISDQKKTTSAFVHELRNPLSLLNGIIQYIEQKHPETKEFKYWDQLQDLVNDMEHIMADASLLNTCNFLNKDNVNLISLLHSIIDNFMPQALTKMINLTISITPQDEEPFLNYFCDPVKIKQVFANLVKNAFEATIPGNFIHIFLSYLPEDNNTPPKLSVEISNNGQMIPEDSRENIFTPFVTYKKGGTGIGLAFVKKVIDLHYGSITVESTDMLTSFTILLPLYENV